MNSCALFGRTTAEIVTVTHKPLSLVVFANIPRHANS